MKRHFVFVVCGAKEHIDTLNYSIPLLRYFSEYPILVVTDLQRNEAEIFHDNIIDIATPEHFTHHQAAIYLKTRLYDFVDIDNGLYCYLDTDVVAISKKVNEIFDAFIAPIIFCTDHCRMTPFTPSAIHDEVYERQVAKQRRLFDLIEQVRVQIEQEPRAPQAIIDAIYDVKYQFDKKRPKYDRSLSLSEGNFFSVLASRLMFQFLSKPYQFWAYLKSMADFVVKGKHDRIVAREYFVRAFEPVHRKIYKTPFYFQNLAEEAGFRYEAYSGKWYNLEGQFLYQENLLIRRVEAQTRFKWREEEQKWYDESGNNLTDPITSDLLRQQLNKTFGLKIDQPNWQHWNGGVFLFNKASIPFLRQWHEWTLKLFNTPLFKTRDQGSLIAAAWHFGLKDHATLPIEFNFILDVNHPTMSYRGDFCFDVNEKRKGVRPYFLHIYHDFGNDNWQWWKDIEVLKKSLP